MRLLRWGKSNVAAAVLEGICVGGSSELSDATIVITVDHQYVENVVRSLNSLLA